MARSGSWRTSSIGALVVIAVLGSLVFEARRTAPIRRSVKAFTELIHAADRGDLSAACKLCTRRYLEDHPLSKAPGGGIRTLPRGIHPNFRAWRQADAVWICPTNRVGPVYAFEREGGLWKFDGLIGRLRADGRVDRTPLDPYVSL